MASIGQTLQDTLESPPNEHVETDHFVWAILPLGIIQVDSIIACSLFGVFLSEVPCSVAVLRCPHSQFCHRT